MKITATQLKNNLGEYLKHVIDDSSEIVITKNDKEIARLVPFITNMEKYFSVRDNTAPYELDKREISYEEFMEIYENTDARLEFINGQIWVLSSPSITHQEILGEMHITFYSYFKDKKCKAYLSPFDVHLKKAGVKDPDVVQPDLLVICDIQDNTSENDRYTGVPALVVEILSKSTRTKDMVYKLNSYMQSGVKEFWVVDPKNKLIQQYTFDDNRIDTSIQFKNGDVIESEIFPGLKIEIESLFGGANS